ncbi:pentatricopeptide repeat-containing protein 1, mitochondrial-like [Antedon mediterranea]|uniref:pentatricopeptide repeat-containing protein 1, mitochondrial-like n=1 Tax=Antedon mediterranea TaxID=105859 RepID=UPI003AF7B6FC
MAFPIRNIITSLSSRYFATSRPSIFAVLQSYSVQYLKSTKYTALFAKYTRTFTINTADSPEGNSDEARKEAVMIHRYSDEWDVQNLPEEDRFGTLKTEDEYELKTFEEVYEVSEENNAEDSDKERFYSGRKNSPIWYSNQMKKLLKKGKLKEALAVLEIRMLKEDNVVPTAYNYDVLIGGCGRAGYTKKAFHLYNDMKKRGLQPTGATYTALFNACAESPWPETDGLMRLKKLHGQLREKEVKINLVTHHAMMKAYAKCGDVQTSFQLFHHLLQSGVKVSVDSFVFLFFACASNKEAGFLFAIEGWRHMLLKGIKPNIITYNLLLRIVRDCGIGDLETANKVLLSSTTLQHKMLDASQVKQKRSQTLLKGQQQRLEMDVLEIADQRTVNSSKYPDLFLINISKNESNSGKGSDIQMMNTRPVQKEDKFLSNLSESATEIDNSSLNDIVPISGKRTSKSIPNMLSLSPNLDGVMSLTAMERPADRLSLLGGTEGLVDSMTSNDVKPDCKTLTLLTEVIPRSLKAETKLLKMIDDLEVKVDIDFYNMLIRKRTKRKDLEGAKALLVDIKNKGLYPTTRTYVALASGCRQEEDGLQLLSDVKASGDELTQPLYNALISAAHTQRNYDYVVKILIDMERNNVCPNQRTITQLENVAGFAAKPNKMNRKLNGFRGFYTLWLDRIGYQKQTHPWSHYRGIKSET